MKKRINRRVCIDFLIFSFATYGFLWVLVESFSAFNENLKPNGWIPYLVLILLSLISGAWRSRPKNKILIDVPNSNSNLEICFGDLFSSSEAIVIPVNEFFDSQLGEHVSENSLHGMFIKNILGSDSKRFNKITKNYLENYDSEKVNRRTGRKKKYKIGTTVVTDIGDCKYFLTVLTKTNINTLKASCTIHELWESLSGLWEAVSNYSNGYTVKLPLIGSGLSSVGLEPKHVLEQIIMSFFYYSKKHNISKKVVIVIHESMKEKIDLNIIEKDWNNGI